MVYYTEYKHPILGLLELACENNRLIGLWMTNQDYFESSLKEKPIRDNSHPTLIKTISWLNKYFDGKNPDINDLELAPSGTVFRQIVWKELCRIPYGHTVSYSEITEKVAKIMGKERMSPQAVGTAIGHNPIGIIIPCHRVIGKDGKMHGYAGGIDKKVYLLKHEKAL